MNAILVSAGDEDRWCDDSVIPSDSGEEIDEQSVADVKSIEVVANDLESFQFPSLIQEKEDEETNGLRWTFNGTVDTPINLATDLKTELKAEHARKFSRPLSSFLSFFPIEFWKIVVVRTNEYARWRISVEKNFPYPEFKDTYIKEMIIFFSLLLRMTLSPTPGRSFATNWRYGNKMSLNRFKQLRAAFYLAEKGVPENESKDALYRVRPLLNVLKKNFMNYIVPGKELAIDESSVACRSKYGRNMIFFNGTKPCGKYHFRFYVLCEADHYNCMRLIVATKSGCDTADGYIEATSDDSDSEEEEDNDDNNEEKKRQI